MGDSAYAPWPGCSGSHVTLFQRIFEPFEPACCGVRTMIVLLRKGRGLLQPAESHAAERDPRMPCCPCRPPIPSHTRFSSVYLWVLSDFTVAKGHRCIGQDSTATWSASAHAESKM